MRLIIDRFESDYAVCEAEDKKMVNIPRGSIPEGAKEGDLIVFEDGGVKIDVAGTMKRRERISALMKDLWK